MSKLLDKYSELFGEIPPLMMTTNYEDPIYKRLMRKALKTGVSITMDDLDKAFEDVEFDLVDDEDLLDIHYTKFLTKTDLRKIQKFFKESEQFHCDYADDLQACFDRFFSYYYPSEKSGYQTQREIFYRFGHDNKKLMDKVRERVNFLESNKK